MSNRSSANTAELAAWIKWLRMSILDVSQDDLAAAGGPSRRTQSSIEKGDAGEKISVATATKYGKAIAELSEGQIHASVMHAALAAFDTKPGFAKLAAPASSPALSKRPSRVSAAAPDVPAASGEDPLYLGIDIDSGQPVSIHGLVQPWPLRKIEVDQGFSVEFRELIFAMALRHPALTIVEQPMQSLVDSAESLQTIWKTYKPHGRVKFLGTTLDVDAAVAFDPIAGVDSLAAALRRAAIFTRAGSDSIAMAWAILKSNEYASRSTAMKAPIAVWTCLNSGAHGLPIYLEPGSTMEDALASNIPDDRECFRASQSHLQNWHAQHTLATWKVELIGEERKIWRTTPVPEPSAEERAQSLWLYDQAFELLPNLLADQGIPAIKFDPFEGLTLCTGGEHDNTTPALWMPTGLNDRHLVFLGPEQGWRPILSPASPQHSSVREERQTKGLATSFGDHLRREAEFERAIANWPASEAE
ncbi:hypothetical protein [Mycobacteroides abscessus]|uniref:hypothetical protein n=1 Tax=Mycobacteroides abscessus TaxID=36809 RepID=UPI0009A593FC|nr:hypothetical protein [Mycobacteroides abscessus]SLH39310.1 Uncharacterised protein [Mycobacteroides abscessus subsp. massiliense]